MPDGVLRVVNCGKESEFEWEINDFSTSAGWYISPDFEFEGSSWCLRLYPNGTEGIDEKRGYMNTNRFNEFIDLRLWRSSGEIFRESYPPIEVQFCVSVKTYLGEKGYERHERNCFEGKGSRYDIAKWIRRSEFSNSRHLLSCGCLTILLIMQKAQYEKKTQSASSAAASSFSEDCHQGDKISPEHECQIPNAEAASVAEVCSCCKEIRDGESLQKIPVHKKCLDQPIMCPHCAEIVSLQNWFGHECQAVNVKTASAPDVCSCCKERRHGESLRKILVHELCLDQPIMCPNCVEIVSLQNWFGHECQAASVKSESSISQTSGSQTKDKTAQDWKKLNLNHENCDVVLRVQGQEFSAHQTILAARSPVFSSLFRSNMKETVTGKVDIEDVDPNCFSDFLHFMYCGEIENLSFDNVYNLFTAADKYDITDLRTMCLELMKEKLSDEISLRKTYLDSFQR